MAKARLDSQWSLRVLTFFEGTAMAIVVTCICGQRLKANDSLAGKQVSCPKCSGRINLPCPSPPREAGIKNVSTILVRCGDCGAGFKARSSLAGRRTRCSHCGGIISVSLPGQPLDQDVLTSTSSSFLDYDTTTLSAAAPLSLTGSRGNRRHRARTDSNTILRLGLGRFWSAWSPIVVTLCVAFVVFSLERLSYALNSAPIEIDARAQGVSHNDYVQLTGRLDFENGMQFETIGGRAYTLVPVVGSNKRLIIYEDGRAAFGSDMDRERTFTGRIVAKGFTDEWNLDSGQIQVVNQFAREGITVPSVALILDATDRPKIQPWSMMLGLASFGVLLWLGTRIILTIQLFLDDDKLARALRSAK